MCLFSPVYLFVNHQYQHALTDVYFILWVDPKLGCFVAGVAPGLVSEALAVSSHVPFTYSRNGGLFHLGGGLKTPFLYFLAAQDTQGSSCFSPRIIHFSKKHWFL